MDGKFAVKLILMNMPCQVKGMNIIREDGKPMILPRSKKVKHKDPVKVIEEWLEVPWEVRLCRKIRGLFKRKGGA